MGVRGAVAPIVVVALAALAGPAGAAGVGPAVTTTAALPSADDLPDAAVAGLDGPAGTVTSTAPRSGGPSDAGLASSDERIATPSTTVAVDIPDALPTTTRAPPGADRDARGPTPVLVPWAAPLTLPSAEIRDPDSGAIGRMMQRLIPALPEENAPLWGGLLLVLVLGAGAAGAHRLRRALPAVGVLPRAATLASYLARAGLALAVLALVPRLFPGALAPLWPWSLLAAAVAVGWSVRDLLPDVVAAVTLGLERRWPPGAWVECAGRRGVIERRTLRATWLRDVAGRSIAIPNRLLLREVVIGDDQAVLHEASLRVGGAHAPEDVRRAIVDALLASPWVRPHPAPRAHRDGLDGELWRVRVPLVSLTFAERFDGELLERVHAALAAVADDGEDGAHRGPTQR